MPPPTLPRISLTTVGERPESEHWYLRVRRHQLTATFDDGATSEPFPYDAVERWNPDAVAVLPHYERDGAHWVILRSALRPPIAVRKEPVIAGAIPLPEGAREGVLWEICAGLVERDERTVDGLARCAAREMQEELAIAVSIDRLRPLGGAIFPSAGVIGECLYMFACEVPSRRDASPPEGDGSPLERGARIVDVLLSDAIAWCDEGAIPDVKTEIALRRLAAKLMKARG